jgi:lysophospholipase L1-like esterase
VPTHAGGTVGPGGYRAEERELTASSGTAPGKKRAAFWRWVRIVTSAAVFVIAGVVIVALRPPLAVALLLAALIHLSTWALRIEVRSEVSRWSRDRQQLFARVSHWILVAALAAAAAVLVWRLVTGDVGTSAYIAGIAGYVGLGVLLTRWRSDPDRSRWWARGILGACVVVGLVSLVVATANVSSAWFIGVGIAVGVAPVGIGLLAEDLAAGGLGWTGPFTVAVGGAGVAAGLAGLSLVGIGSLQAVLLAVALVVIVGAVSSNTSHDVVLVAVAITLIWSLDPQQSGPSPDPHTNSATIVALGDSYMSGEGASAFYDGTNHNHGEHDHNECRRAKSAYPVVAQQDLNKDGHSYQLLFLACSGAVANQLVDHAQYPSEPTTPWAAREPRDRHIDSQHGQAQVPQALAAVAALHLNPAIVLVSIGGNDAGFGDIGATCGLAGDCSVLGKQFLDKLPEVHAKVGRAYQSIRDAFPDARVLVVPYPVPLNESGCGASLLRPNEHRFLAGYVRALDDALKQEALRPEVHFEFLDSGVELFTDRRVRICDISPSKAAVNQLAASPVAGVFLQQVSPRGWFHNTFHPNDRGHLLIAAEVTKWVEGQLPPETPTPPAPATVEGIMGRGFDHCASTIRPPSTCHADRSSWGTAAMARLLWAVLLPVLLVAAGALLASVALMQRWRADHPAARSPLAQRQSE